MNESDFLGIPKDRYGEQYAAHLFDQYKLYVEMADRISARRQLMNTFFLTICTSLLGFVSYVSGKDHTLDLFVLIAGTTITAAWWALLRSYRRLNSVKFRLIGDFERMLPLMPYHAEWRRLKEADSFIVRFSVVESAVPIIIGALFFFAGMFRLFA